MPMLRTYGSPKPHEEGLLVPLRFPELARLDEETGDGRRLDGATSDTRELPRTIHFQFAQEGGHYGSVPVGRLDEATFDEEGRMVSGRGWLLDSPAGRNAALMIKTKVQYHNSIDIAEADVEVKWKSDDPADGEDFWTIDYILFTNWQLGATTFVSVPAFPNAHGLIDGDSDDDDLTAALILADDEITAALNDAGFDPTEELIVDATTQVNFAEADELVASLTELRASGASVVPHADFHLPEPNEPTPLTVTADGCVFGHLGQWGVPHRGHDGRNVFIPRPTDNYRSYCNKKVLTDRGLVNTAPLFFLGGHPDKPLGNGSADKAYGDIANAWADVRVIEGLYGPWLCGRVRPGVSDEAIYAARASGVSGHWKGRDLVAIVSVNCEGFNVPASELVADADGAIFDDNDVVVEMVASFAPPLYQDDEGNLEVFGQDGETEAETIVFRTEDDVEISLSLRKTGPFIVMGHTFNYNDADFEVSLEIPWAEFMSLMDGALSDTAADLAADSDAEDIGEDIDALNADAEALALLLELED